MVDGDGGWGWWAGMLVSLVAELAHLAPSYCFLAFGVLLLHIHPILGLLTQRLLQLLILKEEEKNKQQNRWREK